MPRKKVGKATLFDRIIYDHKSLHEFDDVDAILNWGKIESLLSVIYNAKEGGSSYPPLMMFRAMLMQVWHNLSDVQTEKVLGRDLLFRKFCRISISDPVPDHSTISRFRNALNKKGLDEILLKEVNDQLAEKGAIIKIGEVSIVDATVIEAHRCRKKPGTSSDNTQDKEAGWSVKKGTKGRTETTFGFKAHMSADEDGYVKKVVVTPGNVHDSQVLEDVLTGTEVEVYADSAYAGKPINAMLESKKIKNRIHEKAYRNKPLTEDQKNENTIKSATRYVIERSFGAIKRHYGGAKTRFLGIAKNKGWMTMIAIAHNLKKAKIFLAMQNPQAQCA